MTLLLDQGLPRSTVIALRNMGVNVTHTGDVGLAAAADATILQRAREEGWVVVTLDADFHMYLALSGARGPSVIRIRIEGLRAAELASLLFGVLERCGSDLNAGAMVTVTEAGMRVRRLPRI